MANDLIDCIIKEGILNGEKIWTETFLPTPTVKVENGSSTTFNLNRWWDESESALIEVQTIKLLEDMK